MIQFSDLSTPKQYKTSSRPFIYCKNKNNLVKEFLGFYLTYRHYTISKIIGNQIGFATRFKPFSCTAVTNGTLVATCLIRSNYSKIISESD
jgi:hypothetical protein